MSTPAELYVKGIKKKLRNYYAAWLPNEPLRLGDVGVLQGSLFVRTTSLENLEISFQKREDPDSSPIDYVSESGVSFVFKAAGETNPALPAIPKAKAGIGVEFSREGAFIVEAPETFEPSIEDITAVQNEVLKAFKDGRWNKDWAVIVRIVKAPIASIMISNSSQSSIEISADGDIISGPADLGNARLKFTVKAQKGDIFKIIGAKNITPFFQLARIKKRFFAPPVVSLRLNRSNVSPLDLVTPQQARDEAGVADSLYLDLVFDSDSG